MKARPVVLSLLIAGLMTVGTVASRNRIGYARSAAESGLRSRQDELRWLSSLETEHANLKAALQWSLEQPELGVDALRMCGALRLFWIVAAIGAKVETGVQLRWRRTQASRQGTCVQGS